MITYCRCILPHPYFPLFFCDNLGLEHLSSCLLIGFFNFPFFNFFISYTLHSSLSMFFLYFVHFSLFPSPLLFSPLLCCSLLYSAVLWCSLLCYLLLYSAVLCCCLLSSAIFSSTLLSSAVLSSTLLSSAVLSSTLPSSPLLSLPPRSPRCHRSRCIRSPPCSLDQIRFRELCIPD